MGELIEQEILVEENADPYLEAPGFVSKTERCCCCFPPVNWDYFLDCLKGISEKDKGIHEPNVFEGGDYVSSKIGGGDFVSVTTTVPPGGSKKKKIKKIKKIIKGPQAPIKRAISVAGDSDGKRKLEKYKIIRPCGAGSQSTCFLVEDSETRVKYCMKKYTVGVSEVEYKLEVDAMMEFKGIKNICQLVDSFEYADDYGEMRRCIVMEYCERGHVGKIVRRSKSRPWNWGEFFSWIVQIANGIFEIHKKGFYHHDIKPENIFLKKNREVKIGDFGFSFKSNINIESVPKGGTPRYMSIEQTKCEYGKYYLDSYSLGLTILELGMKHLGNFNLRNEKLDSETKIEEEFGNLRTVFDQFKEKDEFKNKNFYKILEDCIFKKGVERPKSEKILECFKKTKTEGVL